MDPASLPRVVQKKLGSCRDLAELKSPKAVPQNQYDNMDGDIFLLTIRIHLDCISIES